MQSITRHSGQLNRFDMAEWFVKKKDFNFFFIKLNVILNKSHQSRQKDKKGIKITVTKTQQFHSVRMDMGMNVSTIINVKCRSSHDYYH